MATIGNHQIFLRLPYSVELPLDDGVGDIVAVACPSHAVDIERVDHLSLGSGSNDWIVVCVLLILFLGFFPCFG